MIWINKCLILILLISVKVFRFLIFLLLWFILAHRWLCKFVSKLISQKEPYILSYLLLLWTFFILIRFWLVEILNHFFFLFLNFNDIIRFNYVLKSVDSYFLFHHHVVFEFNFLIISRCLLPNIYFWNLLAY